MTELTTDNRDPVEMMAYYEARIEAIANQNAYLERLVAELKSQFWNLADLRHVWECQYIQKTGLCDCRYRHEERHVNDLLAAAERVARNPQQALAAKEGK